MYLNKKVVVIIFLTILAIAGLTLYTFGPYSTLKKAPGSVKPILAAPVKSQNATINNSSLTLATYQNHDVSSDFYTVSFPSSWQVDMVGQSGGFTFQFPEGTGQITLLEVPDNTTLELYVLSQQEPQLKKNITGYRRSDYQKITVNGNEAYQLVYSGSTDTGQTQQTYITGPDMAAVLAFTTTSEKISTLIPIFQSVINSFQWESK